jgi:hypothetical protein
MMSIYKIWINVFKTLKTLLYINPNLVLKFHGNQLVKANLSYCTKCWRTDGFLCAITQLCTNTFSWNFITEQELIKVRSLSIFMIFIFVIPELWYFIHENRLSVNTSYNNSNLNSHNSGMTKLKGSFLLSILMLC